jgi:hypothetical protein
MRQTLANRILAAGALALPAGRIAAAAPASVAAVAPPGYVGAAVCGSCHAEALAVWRASGHARAAAGLDAAERERRSCQACHGTGDAPAAPSSPGVECEACHGAGRDYAAADVMRDPSLARALGLRDLATPAARAALCTTCHDAASSRAPFDLDAAWRRIAH